MVGKKFSQNPLEKLVPLLVIISIALAFGVGVLWQKVSNLEGGTGSKQVVNNPSAGSPPGGIPQPPTNGKLSSEQVAKIPPVTKNDHLRGSRDAKVFLIEYSDLECPFCSRFHPTMEQVLDEYGDRVAWVYRHFPLDQLHPKARPAAEASECAAELGGDNAFWAFADMVFADQQSALADFSGVASKIGLDVDTFNKCVDSGKYADRVQADNDGGLAIGITGTPGNIVLNKNGEAWLIPGALPFAQIKVTLDQALGS